MLVFHGISSWCASTIRARLQDGSVESPKVCTLDASSLKFAHDAAPFRALRSVLQRYRRQHDAGHHASSVTA